jgi:hypothetical protein
MGTAPPPAVVEEPLGLLLLLVVGEAGTPTLTKEKRSLKVPSVLTLKSCSTNQIPILSCGSVSRNALALRLPIKFLVNIPWGLLLLLPGALCG